MAPPSRACLPCRRSARRPPADQSASWGWPPPVPVKIVVLPRRRWTGGVSFPEGMAMLDVTDPIACSRYRIAIAEASRLLEASKYDHSYGRDFARRVGGGFSHGIRDSPPLSGGEC